MDVLIALSQLTPFAIRATLPTPWPHLVGFGAILLTFRAEAKVDASMVEVGGESVMSIPAM